MLARMPRGSPTWCRTYHAVADPGRRAGPTRWPVELEAVVAEALDRCLMKASVFRRHLSSPPPACTAVLPRRRGPAVQTSRRTCWRTRSASPRQETFGSSCPPSYRAAIRSISSTWPDQGHRDTPRDWSGFSKRFSTAWYAARSAGHKPADGPAAWPSQALHLCTLRQGEPL